MSQTYFNPPHVDYQNASQQQHHDESQNPTGLSGLYVNSITMNTLSNQFNSINIVDRDDIPISWTCSVCSFFNTNVSSYCEVCTTRRSQSSPHDAHKHTQSTLPPEIFIKKKDAEKFLCPICRGVFREPHSIGCKSDHLFCKQCLIDYFTQNTVNNCPQCRERPLSVSSIRPRKYVERLINGLMVKCSLNYLNEEEKQNNTVSCAWTGELGNLHSHIVTNCALFVTKCDMCNEETKRCQLEHHYTICKAKRVRCILQCEAMVPRWFMDKHISTECMMAIQKCEECKQEVMRKDIKIHPCTKVKCEYYDYGCTQPIANYNMESHMHNAKMHHMELKIAALEAKISVMDRHRHECPHCSSCRDIPNEYQCRNYRYRSGRVFYGCLRRGRSRARNRARACCRSNRSRGRSRSRYRHRYTCQGHRNDGKYVRSNTYQYQPRYEPPRAVHRSNYSNDDSATPPPTHQYQPPPAVYTGGVVREFFSESESESQ